MTSSCHVHLRICGKDSSLHEISKDFIGYHMQHAASRIDHDPHTSYGISRELEASSPTSRVTVSPHRKVLILRTATVVRCPLRWSNIRSSFLHVLRRVFETDSLAPRGKCECYSSCTSHACPFLAR